MSSYLFLQLHIREFHSLVLSCYGFSSHQIFVCFVKKKTFLVDIKSGNIQIAPLIISLRLHLVLVVLEGSKTGLCELGNKLLVFYAPITMVIVMSLWGTF